MGQAAAKSDVIDSTSILDSRLTVNSWWCHDHGKCAYSYTYYNLASTIHIQLLGAQTPRAGDVEP